MAKTFTCPDCRRDFAPQVPKVTTGGRTICGDCAYRREVFADPTPVVKRRQRRKPGKDQLTL